MTNSILLFQFWRTQVGLTESSYYKDHSPSCKGSHFLHYRFLLLSSFWRGVYSQKRLKLILKTIALFRDAFGRVQCKIYFKGNFIYTDTKIEDDLHIIFLVISFLGLEFGELYLCPDSSPPPRKRGCSGCNKRKNIFRRSRQYCKGWSYLNGVNFAQLVLSSAAMGSM